MLGDNQEEL